MPSVSTFFRLASLIAVAVAVPSKTGTAKRATCTVNSVASAASLGDCTDVVIEAFTVPSGETLTIAAAEGATVTMTGDVTFAQTTEAGPLFILDTASIVFNGGDHNINGNGADYWDGQGTAERILAVLIFQLLTSSYRFLGSGTFEDVTVLNSPAQAISVGTNGAAVITNVNVNNAAGNTNGLGANTDGFDVEGNDITIVGGTVTNQDDCVAINGGRWHCYRPTDMHWKPRNFHWIHCDREVGHEREDWKQCHHRGPVWAANQDATDASVSDITNTVSGITEYGVLITQSYPDNDSTPGTGAPISGITFSGATTTVSVDSDAFTLVVDCGACSGTWDFASLDATGGLGHIISSQDATVRYSSLLPSLLDE
ncbi:Polygalacturonase [Mycena sanguinolenta]|uniref:Polygalacturonase n=1 Tax=Mycena sanguinolenta TaxID=230812 RepID=A0A8H6ZKD6_9AGAR|nr:Polygalacturonase [Mycena sanguinolenta]